MGERKLSRSRLIQVIGLAIGLFIVLASLLGLWISAFPRQNYVWPDQRGLDVTFLIQELDTITMDLTMKKNRTDASIDLAIPDSPETDWTLVDSVIVNFPARTTPSFFGEPNDDLIMWANPRDRPSGDVAGVRAWDDDPNPSMVDYTGSGSRREQSVAVAHSDDGTMSTWILFDTATHWVQAQGEVEADASIPWWEYVSGGARLLWENAFEQVGFSDYVFRFDLAGDWDERMNSVSVENLNVVLQMRIPHSLELVSASADYTSYSTYQDEEGTWFDTYGYTLNADQEAFVVRYRDENAARSKLLLVIALMFSTVVGLQVVSRSLVGWKASNC